MITREWLLRRLEALRREESEHLAAANAAAGAAAICEELLGRLEADNDDAGDADAPPSIALIGG